MKKLVIILTLLLPTFLQASITNCQGVYVGRIWVEKGVGLKAVVYLNAPQNSSGSYWSYFKGWTPEEKKEALSMLMAAKSMGHRVNVKTENEDGCGLQSDYTVTESLYLTTQP